MQSLSAGSGIWGPDRVGQMTVDNLTSVSMYLYMNNKASNDPRRVEYRKPWSNTKASKHILSINRAALSQNFLKTEQFKHNCLPRTIDYIWESMKARQKAISRFRAHCRQHSAHPFTRLGSTAMFWHPTKINTFHRLNANVCHRRPEIIPKNNSGNKMHLR